MKLFLAIASALSLAALPASAGELELGLYTGANESLSSGATLSNGVIDQDLDFDWLGKSFDNPIYWGARITYWPDALPDWGFALDYTHAKVYADFGDKDVSDNFTHLEFTDGLNLVTANVLHKWEFGNGLRAYLGAGAGLSIPHVEVDSRAASIVGKTDTSQYEIAGPAVQALAGLSYELLPNFRVFGEGKLTYTSNRAELHNDAGTFSTDILTGQALVGLSYSFDAPGF